MNPRKKELLSFSAAGTPSSDWERVIVKAGWFNIQAPRARAVRMQAREGEKNLLFLKKKKQKDFYSLASVANFAALDPDDGRQCAKVFCFFSSEKKGFLTQARQRHSRLV